MKVVWRFQGTAVFLARFAIKELATSGIPPLSIAQWMTFLMADGYYSVLYLEFAWILCPRKVSSIYHTTMHVLLFMVLNIITASFLILMFTWFTGQEISFDRHMNHVIWGWMNAQSDRLPLLVEIDIVFVCNECSWYNPLGWTLYVVHQKESRGKIN